VTSAVFPLSFCIPALLTWLDVLRGKQDENTYSYPDCRATSTSEITLGCPEFEVVILGD
jgi:hypothetical protein